MNFSNFSSIAGITAGVFSLGGFIACLFWTAKKHMKPHRATWIIWTFLILITLGTYKTVGATDTLWVAYANVIGCLLMMIFSFKWGVGGTSKLDLSCFAATIIAAGLWLIFDQPLVALLLTLVIDLTGALPTYRKIYHQPLSESRMGWGLFTAGYAINLLAVPEWNLALASYPIYLFLFSASILALTFRETSQA